MKIKAIIHPAEEGGYWAEVPALPGCFTEGETMDGVKSNLIEAVEGWIETSSARHAIPAQDDENAQVVELAL